MRWPARLVLLGCVPGLLLVARAAEERGGAGEAVEWSETAPLAAEALLLDAAFAGGRMVVVGDRGHVLLSDGGDADWRQARVPTRSMLTAVSAVGERIWAVGHDAVILFSPDDGETWTRQHFDPEGDSPLFDVWFGGGSHGFAVGAYGLVLATDDGGTTWTEVTIDPQERHLYAIAEAPDGTLWIAAEYGSVFRSGDRGATWTLTTTPYGGSFFGVLALRDGAVTIFGLRGHVYRSEDAGATWTRIESGTEATLLGGFELGDGMVVIVGLSGTVLVSHDGARSFAARSRPDRLGISAVLPLGGERLLLVGEGGLVAAPVEASP